MSVGSVIRISNGLGCRIFYVDSELNSKTSDTDTDKCKNRTHIRKVFVSTDPKICCTVPNKNFASSCPTRPKPGALESKLNLQSFLLGRYTANASSPLRRLLSTELRLLRVFAPRKSDPLLKRSRYGSPPLRGTSRRRSKTSTEGVAGPKGDTWAGSGVTGTLISLSRLFWAATVETLYSPPLITVG